MNKNYDVVVVGGGPAGSSIATLLERKGWDVALFEKKEFPRYHVGESLVPGCVPILQELGVFKEVEKHSFQKKYGITFLWGSENKTWHVRWDETPSDLTKNYTFEVKRSEFDELLLNNSKQNGVSVFQSTPVISFNKTNTRVTGVTVRTNVGKIDVSAKFVIDASGQSALLGNKEKTFTIDNELRNQAIWSYFKDGGREEGEAAGNIIIESSEIGWLWYIPFSNNVTSVGWVANRKMIKDENLSDQYHKRIKNSKLVKKMLENATEMTDIKTTRDWSYAADHFFGEGYLLLGDAAGFVDPLFSTGVFLAMNGATLGAKYLDKALRDPKNEKEYLQLYQHGYKGFLDKVTAFVHYFYNASLKQDKYFNKADNLVSPFIEMTHRQEFIYLISGLAGINALEKEAIRGE